MKNFILFFVTLCTYMGLPAQKYEYAPFAGKGFERGMRKYRIQFLQRFGRIHLTPHVI